MTDTADAIMDAAERRIRTAGYGGFSFREIAADVGVKSATVHYHFATKDALTVAVVRRYNDRIADIVRHEILKGIEVVEAWRGIFRSALSDGGRMCLCGALGTTAGDLSPEVALEVRRFFDLGVESLMGGRLPRKQAMQVLATLEGAILMAGVRDDASVFEAATAHLAGASWRGA